MAFAAAGSEARASFGLRVREALRRAIAEPGLLGPDQRAGNAQSYCCRHLLTADLLDRYAIAALV